jgi:hypothetical protein
MTLHDGYFGNLEMFEWASRHVSMTRGRGMPAAFASWNPSTYNHSNQGK